MTEWGRDRLKPRVNLRWCWTLPRVALFVQVGLNITFPDVPVKPPKLVERASLYWHQDNGPVPDLRQEPITRLQIELFPNR